MVRVLSFKNSNHKNKSSPTLKVYHKIILVGPGLDLNLPVGIKHLYIHDIALHRVVHLLGLYIILATKKEKKETVDHQSI